VLIPNASTGVNTVLRNLKYEQGDRILYFSTLYGACEKTVEHLVETNPGIGGVRVELKYPVSDDTLIAQFRAAVEGEKERRVKVAVFDTVTSLPGVDLGKLNADFFVRNCHKYVFPVPGCFSIQFLLRALDSGSYSLCWLGGYTLPAAVPYSTSPSAISL
jgi:hercynylcysteine S-oxide lyase